MKNTGREYESLVEDVFKQIIEQSSVNNVVVEKNKTLVGKSTTHEIDIYWEFMLGDIKYATIIQAKDWTSKVPQGELLKLKAIMEDIPGQPRGIFVTKTGYQSGAVDVAKANGIILYELREPSEDDWEGRIKTIVITYNMFVPHTKTEIIPDQDWVQSEFNKLNSDEPLKLSMGKMEDELFLENADGTIWKSLHDIKLEEQAKIGMQAINNHEVILEMVPDKFIDTGNDFFPKIKIKAIKLNISIMMAERQSVIDGTTMVGFILRNLIDDNVVTFDKNAILRTPPTIP